MANAQDVTASIDVGERKVLSAKRTLCFKFHRFALLKHEHGKPIVSPALQCHGHRWAVMLFPRGSPVSSNGYVSMSFHCFDKETENREIEAQFSLQAGNVTSSHVATFGTGKGSRGYGRKDFANYADLLDESQNFLVNGTLTVKVELQVYLDQPEPWNPTRTLKHRMLEMFHTGVASDVEFMVGDKQFRAHKFVLAMSAPTLFQLAEDVAEDTAIQIDGVDPIMFEKMLQFLYSEELAPDFQSNAEAVLDIADKFGCTNLKLSAESELASSCITVENAAEMFLLAERKNCPLLKEATTQFFVVNGNEVMKTQGFEQLKESNELLVELMGALTDPPTFHATDVDRMGVSTLRRKLDEAGLDVDGTREMLVKRLKTKA